MMIIMENISQPSAPVSRTELGRFFIGANCEGCKTCFSLAPSNITFLDIAQKCTVTHQPMTKKEMEVLTKAYYACPHNAFHDKADVRAEGMD